MSKTIARCTYCGEYFCYICTKAGNDDYCSQECEDKDKEQKHD